MLDLNNIDEEVDKRINALEGLALGFHLSILSSVNQKTSVISSTSNDYLGEVLNRLSDYYICKAIMSLPSDNQEIYTACIYRALIANPDVKIKNSYTLSRSAIVRTNLSETNMAFTSTESFILALGNIHIHDFLLKGAKELMEKQPEYALSLSGYD
jgi:hypothetical protein